MIEAELKASYSQNGEDKIVLRHLNKESGTVLDIGAGDGKTFSNSLALIERGWKGILIEPSPRAFAKLLELHGGNPNVTLLNAAVGVEDRIVKFYESGDSLYSTTKSDQAVTWTSRGMKYTQYWVPQISPKTLTNQLGACANVLSIDIEGASFDVLCQCPLDWDPSIIIIEHDGRAVEISGWGRDHKYDVVALNAENIILQRPA